MATAEKQSVSEFLQIGSREILKHARQLAPGSTKAVSLGTALTIITAGWTSNGLQVTGGLLSAALVGLHLVRDLLTFNEAGHARALDGGDVDEGILPAVVRLDEAEALLFVEPLNGADAHVSFRMLIGNKIAQANAQHALGHSSSKYGRDAERTLD
jgi:hypothetical protein